MKDWKKVGKALIPLSLMTFSSAFANNGNGCCPQVNNCCPVNCCEPCCVPRPKKCIDCECYVPQYYDLQCDCGIFVSADFLYWYSREKNLEVAEKFLMVGSFSSSGGEGAIAKNFAAPVKYAHLDAPWEPGFRIGIGWNTDCDGWDLYLNYTWYRAEETTSISADFEVVSRGGEFGIFNPWINGGFLKSNDFNKVAAKWSLHFNQLDLELGKRYWLSRCFNLRPYAGVRGAWTKTNFDVVDFIFPGRLSNLGITTFEEIDHDDFKNKYWGVGLLGGIQPNWVLGSWCGCGIFSIYGNLEASAIWGKFRGEHFSSSAFSELDDDGTFTSFEDTLIVFTSKESVYQMVGILDLALGIRWEDHWCCDRYSTAIDLGWEHHYWIGHGMRHQSNVSFEDPDSFADQTEQFYLNSNSIISDLVFGGLVVRLRFDF